jgi:hypothetical protein
MEAMRIQFLDQLSFDEMDLPEIGPCGVTRLVVKMLHRGAAMGIALHTKPSH